VGHLADFLNDHCIIERHSALEAVVSNWSAILKLNGHMMKEKYMALDPKE